MSYLEAGSVADADRALRAGYAICRTDAETDLGMGLLAFTRGRTAQADGYIRIALAKEPDSAAGHSLLARVLSRAGEHRAARSEAVIWKKLQSWSRDADCSEAQEDATLGDYAAAALALQAEARNAIRDAGEVRVQIAAITARRRGAPRSDADRRCLHRGDRQGRFAGRPRDDGKGERIRTSPSTGGVSRRGDRRRPRFSGWRAR